MGILLSANMEACIGDPSSDPRMTHVFRYSQSRSSSLKSLAAQASSSSPDPLMRFAFANAKGETKWKILDMMVNRSLLPTHVYKYLASILGPSWQLGLFI